MNQLKKQHKSKALATTWLVMSYLWLGSVVCFCQGKHFASSPHRDTYKAFLGFAEACRSSGAGGETYKHINHMSFISVVLVVNQRLLA